MSEHTPGPWQWTSDGHPIIDLARFRSPGYYNNPELHGPNGEDIITCGEYTVHNKVEDARLIAAAPELLNALEMAEATIVRLERHAPGSAQGTLDVVRAAIAKAEGRES